MFNAVLSDDGAYVLIFHEDEEEPEVMETHEFVAIYGADVLSVSKKVDPSEQAVPKTDEVPETPNVSEPTDTSESHAEDVKHYWKAFRRLVKNCGEYSHKVKLQENVDAGVLKTQVVAYKYCGGVNSDRELAERITALNSLRFTAVANLDYWSRRLGYKPMSTPQDVKRYHLERRADTEILLEHLSRPEFRKRMYYRIDKYSRSGECRSPAEIVTEVLLSFKKQSHQPS